MEYWLVVESAPAKYKGGRAVPSLSFSGFVIYFFYPNSFLVSLKKISILIPLFGQSRIILVTILRHKNQRFA